jgi:hypothetical protein
MGSAVVASVALLVALIALRMERNHAQKGQMVSA